MNDGSSKEEAASGVGAAPRPEAPTRLGIDKCDRFLHFRPSPKPHSINYFHRLMSRSQQERLRGQRAALTTALSVHMDL